ncbi:MAG: hypothetical protein IJT94_16910, partial [Oscillibacter sp.]|nr:hypothetical protein [Oscillibacter sp.]
MRKLFTDRRLVRLTVSIGGMLTALALIGVFLYAEVSRLLDIYMEVQGEKQAETLAELTRRQFQVELSSLYTIASELPRIEGMRTDALRAIQEADDAGRIGVQRIDGRPFYGETYTIEEFPCIARAVHGENAISFLPGKGLMFAVPALREGNVSFVVYRLYGENVLYDRFGVTSYSGMGRTRIEDREDRVIVTSLPDDSREKLIFDEKKVAEGTAVLERALYADGSDALFRRSSMG